MTVNWYDVSKMKRFTGNIFTDDIINFTVGLFSGFKKLYGFLSTKPRLKQSRTKIIERWYVGRLIFQIYELSSFVRSLKKIDKDDKRGFYNLNQKRIDSALQVPVAPLFYNGICILRPVSDTHKKYKELRNEIKGQIKF